MKFDKRTMTVVLIAALAVGGYFLWKWYENKKSANSGASPTGSTGTNLNSVAPELIGGSTGPSLGPAVSLPININLTTTDSGGNVGNSAGGHAWQPPPQSASNVPALTAGTASAGTAAAVAGSPGSSTQAGATQGTPMQATNATTPNAMTQQATAAANPASKNVAKSSQAAHTAHKKQADRKKTHKAA